MLREFARRCLMLLRRRQFDADLEEEMRLHRELREQEQIERGLSPQQAHYAAQRRFGNDLVLREGSREMWGWNWLENLIQDLHHGLRMLSKNPGFTTLAVLTLALGIGANTAIFTVIDAVILELLPYPQPNRLVTLCGRAPKKPQNDLELVHPSEFLEWRNHARTFESLALVQGIPVNAQGQDGAEQISGLWSTPELFQVFGVAPALGRAFTDQETRAGENNVTILSHGYWQSHFGAGPKVLGRRINLDGQQTAVIGVMPVGFRVATLDPDVYLPMPLDPAKPEAVGSRSFQCFGRLRPGVTISSAQAEMTVIQEQVARLYPPLSEWGVTVLSLHSYLAHESKPALFTLLGVVAFVLLIACANLAACC